MHMPVMNECRTMLIKALFLHLLKCYIYVYIIIVYVKSSFLPTKCLLHILTDI